MLNPTLSQKKESNLTVSDNAKKLFQVIYSEQNKEEKDSNIPKIKASELISKMAFYYEKIRNTVDYKEESLFRKNAIERILKRQITIQGAKDEMKIAGNLLIELIRAGYLRNNYIEEKKIAEIGPVIAKYLKLKKYFASMPENNFNEKGECAKWIMGMAACDIEERIGRDIVKQTIIKNIYANLIENIKLPVDSAYQEDKEIQIYIGIHRIFMKFDKEMIEFILFKYFNGGWADAEEEEIAALAGNIKSLRQLIDKQADHPLAGQFNKIINSYTVYYTILNDVISSNPVEIYEKIRSDIKAFPRLIKQSCAKRYKEARAKLRRAALRSIIYLLLTKTVLVMILEIPVTIWLNQAIHYDSLIINVTFPPFLLFLVAVFTRVPSDANTAKIIEGIDEITFNEKKRKEPFILRKPLERGGGITFVFGAIYTITFFITFGLIIWALNKMNFNFVSMIIFLFFLTLVSFFGIRIRKAARELFIVERKENIIGFITDFFYIPIIEVGKWLNEKFSRMNVFVFILDFIIEAPFKIFVEITEEWTKYVKERKEDIM